MTEPKRRYVAVRWEDAGGFATWTTMEDLREWASDPKVGDTISVGWILYETDDVLVLGSRWSLEPEQWGMVQRIPKSLVREVYSQLHVEVDGGLTGMLDPSGFAEDLLQKLRDDQAHSPREWHDLSTNGLDTGKQVSVRQCQLSRYEWFHAWISGLILWVEERVAKEAESSDSEKVES